MASQQDQRASDFQEVQQTLAQHPHIKITQTEGEPPDCYELEYKVTGLVKDTDGNISKVSRHLILLTLPFGYPHFPPAVKPLTAIFHPDMDPDAVRISSYWHENPSLAKLVLHLGDMICGQIYHLEEPFNQEAADWYAAHENELPCETVTEPESPNEAEALELDFGLTDLDLESDEPAQGQDIDLSLALEPAQEVEDITDLGLTEEESSGPELSLELESPPPVEDITAGLSDSEEEESAQDTFDLDLELDLVPEVPEQPEPEPSAQDLSPKLEEIRLHIKKKEMEIAARMLAGLPAISEVEELRTQVKTTLAKRDDLLAELQIFEDEDNFEEAKKVFKKIKSLAVDTPDLSEIGRRLEQSQSMLDAFSLPPQQDEEQSGEDKEVSLKKGKKGKKAPNESPRKERQKTAVRAEAREEISKTKRQINRTIQWNVNIPVAPLAALAGIGILVIGGGLLYTRDTNNLLDAELALQEAQRLFRQRDCQDAETKANRSRALLDTVLLPLSTKKRLRKELETLNTDKEYQLCKQGKSEYNGKTIPLAESKIREQLDKLIAEAEHALQKGDLGIAGEAYKKAWQFAIDNNLTTEAISLKKQTVDLFLKDALERVAKARKGKNWEAVASSCRQGIDAAKELGDNDTQEKLQKFLAEALFNYELSKLKFNKAHGQWQQLLEQLKHLQQLLKENPSAATPEKKLELEQLMARAQFYQLLYLANEAYSNKGDYAESISYYEQAIAVLKNKQSLFTQEEKNTVGEIQRTIILLKISDVYDKAMAAEEARNLSDALQNYRKTKELLQTPGLTKDESLTLLEEKVDSKISQFYQLLKKQRNKKWLDKNYKQIFTEAYPSARAELLSDPRVDFMKMLRGQELYKVSCLEERTYRLELYYLLNPSNGHWTPYSGQVNQE